MTFNFDIPTAGGVLAFAVEPGTSLIFVGANGGGKTRLAVEIEKQLGLNAHRISAHRALALNPAVAKISEQAALGGLRTGHAAVDTVVAHRTGSRWGNKEAISLLNDYDFLVQALFADQANVSLATHKQARLGSIEIPASTKLEKLVEIWGRILGHRELEITGDDIRVRVVGNVETYPASDMSDGERAIFYLVGQALAAAPDSLIIFDEPELHIHRSLMSRLWDELEAARNDCAFVLISHDLEFIAAREGQKFVLLDYAPATGWAIEPVPAASGFSEEITTLILGSRRPVLFVEGTSESLDAAIYRACFPLWTIIPSGSCEQVIHSVMTMRANASLTRIACAGLADADGRSEAEVSHLSQKGVGVLPVSELENLFLMPSVVHAILVSEGHAPGDATSQCNNLHAELFVEASHARNKDAVVLRHVKRRIDAALKRVDLGGAATVMEVDDAFGRATAAIDVMAAAELVVRAIDEAISNNDAAALLRWYDNKGVMAIAAKTKGVNVPRFKQWLVRSLANGSAPAMAAAVQALLPKLSPA